MKTVFRVLGGPIFIGLLLLISMSSASLASASTVKPGVNRHASAAVKIVLHKKTGKYGFMPKTLTVKVGTTVTWTNASSAPHTVTSDTGLFDSGVVNPNGTFSFTFTKAGTYKYHCSIHLYMHGTIIVK